MAEWDVTTDRIRGAETGQIVTIDVESWRPGGDPPALSADVDAVAVGTTTALGLPTTTATLAGAGETRTRPLGPDIDSLHEGAHHVVIDAELETHVTFEGPATFDSGWIRFSESTPIAIGFCGTERSRPTIRVPSTPSGLAAAVTAAGRTHQTTGPDRSHPGFRQPVPRVRFGDRSIPDGLSADGEGPSMTVPDSVTAVLVAAPLAYYLGASIRIESGQPELRSDATVLSFESLPTFADDVASSLRRLCYLDGRVRTLTDGTEPSADVKREIESELGGYDPATLAESPPVERLSAALDISLDVSDVEWPLATYVDEDVENGRYLPYILDRLSLVYPASASALDPRALLKRSLDEFFRGEAPNVEAVDPSLAESRFHAWRGSGTPVDAYTLFGSETPASDRTTDTRLSVDVVCNDPEMWAERDVAEIYRRGLDVQQVRVHRVLTTAELAAVLERRTDFVHFIGHCEVDGLVCADGTLAAADIERCGVKAFFLNACGSYYEGYDLVRQGATVGAVTLTAVLDEQAVRLGTAFARLLAAGFAFERALSLARGEIIVGRDYAVVGDGGYRLQPPYGTPGMFELERDGETFIARYDVLSPDAAGRTYVDPFDGVERLCGEEATASLDRSETISLLERFSSPVRYEGDLWWSDELARHVEPTGQ